MAGNRGLGGLVCVELGGNISLLSSMKASPKTGHTLLGPQKPGVDVVPSPCLLGCKASHIQRVSPKKLVFI